MLAWLNFPFFSLFKEFYYGHTVNQAHSPYALFIVAFSICLHKSSLCLLSLIACWLPSLAGKILFFFLWNTCFICIQMRKLFEKPYFFFFTHSSMFFPMLAEGNDSNSTGKFCLVTVLRGPEQKLKIIFWIEFLN